MPLGIFPALLVLAILVTLGSAYYMLINARAIAALFNKPTNEVATGPGPRRATRGRAMAAVILFVIGSIASPALWFIVASGAGNDVVESHPAEVQRP